MDKDDGFFFFNKKCPIEFRGTCKFELGRNVMKKMHKPDFCLQVPFNELN